MDIEKVKYNIDTEFHMLRHFESLSRDASQRFIKNNYLIDNINENLKLAGSRFHSDFAESIGELLTRIKNNNDFSTHLGENGKIVIHFHETKANFPDGVGLAGVVPYLALSTPEQQRVYKVKNRGVSLKHLNVSELPKAWEYCVVLKPSENNFIFITAFPGPIAMPLPEHSMPQNLFQECADFWSKHVFLVLST